MKDSEFNNDKPKSGRGGARPGAGRPQGTKDRITIQSLLTAFESASGGQRYETVLFEDFYRARESGDMVMAHKYHNLILNKLAPTLLHTEVEDTGSTLEGRARAFALALKAVVEEDPAVNPSLGYQPVPPEEE
jgi:hypothetical protein